MNEPISTLANAEADLLAVHATEKECKECNGFGWNLNRAQDGSGDFYRDKCEPCDGTGAGPMPDADIAGIVARVKGE